MSKVRTPSEWWAWLDSPGGALRFGLRLDAAGRASLVNGDEVIPVGALEQGENGHSIPLLPYDATLAFRQTSDGRLTGQWRGRRDPTQTSTLPFHATREPESAGGVPEPRFSGRWAVQFSQDHYPAVGVFQVADDGVARGTFLTALGDFRFLSGHARDGRLELSCFDGAHAFLFRAELKDDDRLEGEFWSAGHWHETWTARRDLEAAPRDPYDLTRWQPQVDLAALRFRDVESGSQRSVSEVLGEAPAALLYLYGSWCPNCVESARVVEDLRGQFTDRGLRVVGLAFEHDLDPDDAVAAVQRTQRATGSTFPVLIAGSSDKDAASQAFPAVDRIRSYPTFVVLDRARHAIAICTGYQGAATPDHEAFLALLTQALETALA